MPQKRFVMKRILVFAIDFLTGEIYNVICNIGAFSQKIRQKYYFLKDDKVHILLRLDKEIIGRNCF